MKFFPFFTNFFSSVFAGFLPLFPEEGEISSVDLRKNFPCEKDCPMYTIWLRYPVKRRLPYRGDSSPPSRNFFSIYIFPCLCCSQIDLPLALLLVPPPSPVYTLGLCPLPKYPFSSCPPPLRETLSGFFLSTL